MQVLPLLHRYGFSLLIKSVCFAAITERKKSVGHEANAERSTAFRIIFKRAYVAEEWTGFTGSKT